MLTLDEVREVRFRTTKRIGQGYDVQDVDLFVDRVEEAFAKMTNDSDILKRQLDALKKSSSEAALSGGSGEAERLRGELEQVKREAKERQSGLEAAEREIARLKQLNGASAAGDRRAEQLSSEVRRLADENERLRREVDGARSAVETAQRAINEGPLENMVVTTSAEASPAVVRLVQLATEQAEQVVSEAKGEAKRQIADAEQRSFNLTTEARSKADRVEAEARSNAEKMTSDARNEADRLTGEALNRAAQIDKEADDRRHELFDALENERDDLRSKVDHLRQFEEIYRKNLTNHLKAQLDAVSHARPQPVDIPELARPNATPRLDALMGDQN